MEAAQSLKEREKEEKWTERDKKSAGVTISIDVLLQHEQICSGKKHSSDFCLNVHMLMS